MTAWILMAVLGAAPLQPITMDEIVVCRDTCTRYVPPRAASKICADCIRKGSGVAAWTDAYRGPRTIPEPVVEAALQDPSWEIRWGVLRARARARYQDPSATLSAYIRSQPEGAKRIEACVVAVGAGALQEGKVLQVARKACAPYRDAIREAIEPHLYLPRAASQEEALRQLMLFLDEGAGRIIFNAIRDRPDALDEVPAALLVRIAREDFPVGKIVLKDANAESAREVNRLLAIYSRQIQVLRNRLLDPELERRRDAVDALAIYLPLSEPELEGVIATDEDRTIRLHAADALADSAERSLAAEVAARIPAWERGEKTPELQRRWVELLANAYLDGCGEVLELLADNARLDASVRGAAVGAMGKCGEGKVLPRLLAAAEAEEDAIRAGAMRALADVPVSKAASEAIAQALVDPSPKVVAEALKTLTTQNPHTAAVRAPHFLGHSSADVRLSAARMLAADAREKHVPLLRDRVVVETDARVRAELARALGAAGGPVATATLAELQANDPDAYVRKVAVDSLRNLGFHR